MPVDLTKVLQIAHSIQQDAHDQGFTSASIAKAKYTAPQLIPDRLDELMLFDILITEEGLRETTRQLFIEKHYAIAVEEAYKYLNNLVKKQSGSSADGATLMRNVFSVNNPTLQINNLQTQSQRDQQQGYMDIFAGCMTGIRNPRAHEHRYLDDSRIALEMLMLANHLTRLVNKAKKPRRKRSK